MGIIERLESDFKAALKSRQEVKVSTLRLIRAALKNKEKEGPGALTEDSAVKVLKTLLKQREEAAEAFAAAGRKEQAAKELAERDLITAYLPAQADEQTIRAAVSAAISETGANSPKAIGAVMKAALHKLGPGADGKLVNKIAQEMLKSA